MHVVRIYFSFRTGNVRKGHVWINRLACLMDLMWKGPDVAMTRIVLLVSDWTDDLCRAGREKKKGTRQRKALFKQTQSK